MFATGSLISAGRSFLTAVTTSLTSFKTLILSEPVFISALILKEPFLIEVIEMEKRIPVGVLGATGTVGQRFVQLLANHPWFEVAVVTGSVRTAGRPYR
ncbi:MAG: hypothetical protein ABFQ64_06735, partial [Campylobacterota bacterium]